jgi:SAM-dependent methyltransferase
MERMPLHPEDERKIKEFYTASSQAYRSHAGRVHWSERRGQETRFRVLGTVGDLCGSSILDVGSGLGDMYAYFKEHLACPFRYTGVELLEDFAAEAKWLHPSAEFLAMDFGRMPEDRTFDYVLSSGALNFKVEDNAKHYFGMIEKMYRLADKAAGFNMLDRARHADDETYAAYDIQEVANHCRAFAARVEIVTDYLDDDFTVFLYKN